MGQSAAYRSDEQHERKKITTARQRALKALPFAVRMLT
jgi:hypothetical protein